MTQALLAPIYDFLHCETPALWVDVALENQAVMLIDHANCEKKAAATAMSLMTKYLDRTELLFCAARLAREELHHFEQVVEIMQKRNVTYTQLSPSRYASGMIKHTRHHDDLNILVDRLIIGAYIEARSCERFAKIAPHRNHGTSPIIWRWRSSMPVRISANGWNFSGGLKRN
jgi:tRNA-(ms[2]io[6]A)-hydroxylase